MHDALLTENITVMKNRTLNSVQTWVTARCDAGTFFDTRWKQGRLV